MKLIHFVFFGKLLHLAVTTPVYNILEDFTYQDPRLWQRSGKVEGDMVLTPQQYERLYKNGISRNGIIDDKYRWPNRTIPYEFSEDFTAEEKVFIADVLKKEYSKTCITVVPRTDQADYVHITSEKKGCWSWIGRTGGKQQLNLQRGNPGCIFYRTIVHEFMHAAGFYHQHASTNRDDYISIIWNNVEKGKQSNFAKYGSGVVNTFGEPYDYESVMHYGPYTFAINGQKTIIPKKNIQIGAIPKLSPIDIRKINKMYKC